jgi:cyclopropane-fatty-acyl-phospholipid synthase
MGGVLGSREWRLRLWDGTEVAPVGKSRFVITLTRPRALDVLVGGTPERAFGRAYVAGDLDIEPLDPFLECGARTSVVRVLKAWPGLVAAAVAMGARPRRGVAGDAEARLRGRAHSRQRDAAAVRHHYDLPPQFYALWLDESMTYSCAYFEDPSAGIDAAQRAKLDLICRKLRLRAGERLLDVGCGWGSLMLHAARHHGVGGVGITLSPRQVEVARHRAAELGLQDRVEFRLSDYRDIAERDYDAVASIGMIEHVSRSRLATFTRAVHRAVRPGGRVLIHGITCRPSARSRRLSFINTFVFPDGQLEDVGHVSSELEGAGLEVRDVENLREHYVLTLQHWARRLESNWDEAVSIAGVERARVWRLYMTGAIAGFRTGAMSVHQTLAVRPTAAGRSGMPLLRDDWYPRTADTRGRTRAEVDGAPTS